MTVPILDGIVAKTITSSRITTRVLFSGAEQAIPVLFLHGNTSSATFWEELMLSLPAAYRGIAPDQRGYGDADSVKKIDATRGMCDLSDDAAVLLDTLGIKQAHIVGHSAGGSVLWQMLLDFPERFLSATLVSPGSPYGFGGTKDIHGTPNYDDFAGSGGGVVNANFTKLMDEGNRDSDDPTASPRIVMNQFIWKPPFVPQREEDLLSSLLSTHIGAQDYPGDMTPSANWPNVAPGAWGIINALSPKYAAGISRLNSINPKPKVLWVRGADDAIISDNSFFDLGTLGSLGYVPGWPGAEIYPPQPMIGQIRTVLEAYQANGGVYQEVVLADCGHSPYIEKPAEFNAAFLPHIA